MCCSGSTLCVALERNKELKDKLINKFHKVVCGDKLKKTKKNIENN